MQTQTNNSNSSIIKPSKISHLNETNKWFGFLILWGLAALILLIPWFDNFEAKLFVLLPVAIFTMVCTLIRPASVLPLWCIVLGFIVAQTGFQVQVGEITFSALEIIILVLLLIIILWNNDKHILSENFKFPGQAIFIVFIIYSILQYIVIVALGQDPLLALFQMKGFILYPLMAYIFVLGIRSKQTLIWAIIVPLIVFLVVAGKGILEYQAGVSAGDESLRIGSEYAPINLYGITLASFSLLLLGIGTNVKRLFIKLLLIGISVFLMIGSFTSVARTVWVMYAIGLLLLFVLNPKSRIWVILIGVGLASILISNYANLSWRIWQVSDSSTVERLFYLKSGWEAFKANWLTGAGWGNGYFYYENIGLVPSGYMPWYHNDYLNLAVQIGLPGLIMYLGYWGSVLFYAVRRVIIKPRSFEMTVAIGAFAGLLCLLVSACSEHVLWRPDIGGVVGWMSGILLASLHLEKENRNTQVG